MTVWKIVVKKRKKHSSGFRFFSGEKFCVPTSPEASLFYWVFFHSKLEIQCMFYWISTTLKFCLVNRIILGNVNFTFCRMKLEVDYHFSFLSENYLILIFSPSFPLGIPPQLWRLLRVGWTLKLIYCLRLCVPSSTTLLHVEYTKYVTSRHTYYWRK